MQNMLLKSGTYFELQKLEIVESFWYLQNMCRIYCHRKPDKEL